MRHTGGTALLVTLLITIPARGADLLEPWEVGFTEVELFMSFGDEAAGTTGLLGFGLNEAVSLGLSLGATEGEPPEVGLLLMYSSSLGRRGDLDVWAELLAGTSEAELQGAERSFGCEWSAAGAGLVPYLRFSVSGRDGRSSVHPLAGLLVPVGKRLELHFEVSSEEPEEGGWPIHLAIGPNWKVQDAIELIPELSLIHDPADGGHMSFVFTLGVIFDRGSFRMEPF